jgi:hypothetical protein
VSFNIQKSILKKQLYKDKNIMISAVKTYVIPDGVAAGVTFFKKLLYSLN